MSTSTLAPAIRERGRLSSGDFYYEVTLTSPVTIAFDSIPALSLTLPAPPPSGESLFASVSVNATTIAIAGPATVIQRTAAFPTVAIPFTMNAGVTYRFAVYGVVRTSLLYAANADDSITIYDGLASGDIAPLRRIAGSSTQLHGPVSIAVDAGGVVWVLNAGVDPLSVTAYAPNADGNAGPLHAYTLTNVHNNALFPQVSRPGSARY